MTVNNHIELYENTVLRFSEKEIPEILEKEVLVKVHLSGLCGSDIPRIFDNGAHFYPITLGHEFSGEVVKVGSKVKAISKGENISCAPLVPCMECVQCNKGYYSLCKSYSFVGSRRQGGNAEYVAIPEVSCFKLPKGISMEQGAFFEPVTVGLHPIIMNDGCNGMNVVIIGAGTIGLLTLQVAKALGAKTVTTVDVSDDKLELAKELGADFTVNSLNSNQVKWLSENDELTSNQLILELAGVPAAFKLSLKIAGPRAHIYLIGTIHKDFDISFKEYEQILRKEATITGSWMNYSYLYPGKEWEVASQLFLENKINTTRLIDGIYNPEDYIERVSSLPTEPLRGKVLLNWI